MKLFSFVDVLFVGKPPSAADGGHVAHDEDGCYNRELVLVILAAGNLF